MRTYSYHGVVRQNAQGRRRGGGGQGGARAPPPPLSKVGGGAQVGLCPPPHFWAEQMF